MIIQLILLQLAPSVAAPPPETPPAAQAQSNAPANGATPDEEVTVTGERNPVTCHYEVPVGSMLRRQVCMTAAQVHAQEAMTRTQLENIQRENNVIMNRVRNQQ